MSKADAAERPRRPIIAAAVRWAHLLGVAGKPKGAARTAPRVTDLRTRAATPAPAFTPAPAPRRAASAAPPGRERAAVDLGLDMEGLLSPRAVRAVRAERARLTAIIGSPEAKGAPDLARHLALESDLPAASTLQVLRDIAAASPRNRFAGRFDPYARRGPIPVPEGAVVELTPARMAAAMAKAAPREQ